MLVADIALLKERRSEEPTNLLTFRAYGASATVELFQFKSVHAATSGVRILRFSTDNFQSSFQNP